MAPAPKSRAEKAVHIQLRSQQLLLPSVPLVLAVTLTVPLPLAVAFAAAVEIAVAAVRPEARLVLSVEAAACRYTAC